MREGPEGTGARREGRERDSGKGQVYGRLIVGNHRCRNAQAEEGASVERERRDVVRRDLFKMR